MGEPRNRPLGNAMGWDRYEQGIDQQFCSVLRVHLLLRLISFSLERRYFHCSSPKTEHRMATRRTTSQCYCTIYDGAAVPHHHDHDNEWLLFSSDLQKQVVSRKSSQVPSWIRRIYTIEMHPDWYDDTAPSIPHRRHFFLRLYIEYPTSIMTGCCSRATKNL